jgi:hypothetical protein
MPFQKVAKPNLPTFEVIKPKRIVLIGLGGIGSNLVQDVVETVAYTFGIHKTEIVFVDGDDYEAKNAQRQIVGGLRNKAERTLVKWEDEYPTLKFSAVKAYVGQEQKFEGGKMVLPVSKVLQDGDWVLCGVDNNTTRLIVSKQMQQFQNGVLIDGGNGLMDGSVQTYIRQNSKDMAPTIEAGQPNLRNPNDKAPYQMSCEELEAAGVRQIRPTNKTAAHIMYLVLWRLLEGPVSTGLASVAYFSIENIVDESLPLIRFQTKPY